MMVILEFLVDIILATGIFCVSLLSLSAKEQFQSIILFICVGLLVALTWARMGAVDIALAEASIGAGVTGALLITAWCRLERTKEFYQNHRSKNSADD